MSEPWGTVLIAPPLELTVVTETGLQVPVVHSPVVVITAKLKWGLVVLPTSRVS